MKTPRIIQAEKRLAALERQSRRYGYPHSCSPYTMVRLERELREARAELADARWEAR